MPKVSINILTKNRAELLKKALGSIASQSFQDFEIVVVNDGSTDSTEAVLKEFSAKGGSAFGGKNLKIITHMASLGITLSRQEALEQAAGEYIAILDDDDEWANNDKLAKQVQHLENHSDVVLVGGGIVINKKFHPPWWTNSKFRPQEDGEIRKTMLLRNNFFTSSVMFRKEAAIKAGGFIKDEVDFGEDYDLWLRIGILGKMYNFQEVFVNYRLPSYNSQKFKAFLNKQIRLIQGKKRDYPWYGLARLILKIRTFF